MRGNRLAQLTDFENRGRIFPAIDSRIKFSLLTIGHDVTSARFTFFLTDPTQLNEPERVFTLSAEDIARINPNTKTAPVFRSRADAELTAKTYARVPVLIDDAGGEAANPWGLSFMRMFDMANDSGLFRTTAPLRESGLVREGSNWVQPEGLRRQQSELDIRGGSDDRSLALAGGGTGRSPDRFVPLYEAKMIHQFDHRWATYDGSDSRDATAVEKADPGFGPTPRYWVPEREVGERLAAKGWTRGWLLGWRDIARATDERTVISSALPRSGCGDTLLLMLPALRELKQCACLFANLGSLVLDYSARQKVGSTHLKYNVFKQLPVLPPTVYTTADVAFIVPRVLDLTYTSHSMAPFARDLGYDGPPFPWDEGRRAVLRAELDAWYARAYGLTHDELRYILDPADVRGPDYPSETFRVLKKNEIARYGEYRTARLVLAAWDAQEARPAAAK